MKHFLLVLIILISFSLSSYSQSYKLTNGQLVEQKDSVKTKSVKTTLTVVKKGITYPVYKGARGGHYIIRTSKKTNKEYKQYLKIVN